MRQGQIMSARYQLILHDIISAFRQLSGQVFGEMCVSIGLMHASYQLHFKIHKSRFCLVQHYQLVPTSCMPYEMWHCSINQCDVDHFCRLEKFYDSLSWSSQYHGTFSLTVQKCANNHCCKVNIERKRSLQTQSNYNSPLLHIPYRTEQANLFSALYV